MKYANGRQYSRHRDQTPAALQLAERKPPVTARRAATGPDGAEPLSAPSPSRQARRRALRDEAKALRRAGPLLPIAEPETQAAQARAAAVTEPEAAAARTVEPVPAASATFARSADPEPIIADPAPLPRSRAPVVRPKGLALVSHRLRRLFGMGQAAPVPSREAAIATQLRRLQGELAVLQQAIDGIIDRVHA